MYAANEETNNDKSSRSTRVDASADTINRDQRIYSIPRSRESRLISTPTAS